MEAILEQASEPIHIIALAFEISEESADIAVGFLVFASSPRLSQHSYLLLGRGNSCKFPREDVRSECQDDFTLSERMQYVVVLHRNCAWY